MSRSLGFNMHLCSGRAVVGWIVLPSLEQSNLRHCRYRAFVSSTPVIDFSHIFGFIDRMRSVPLRTSELWLPVSCEGEAGYLVGIPHRHNWLCRLDISRAVCGRHHRAQGWHGSYRPKADSSFAFGINCSSDGRRYRICPFRWRWSFPIRYSCHSR